MWRLRTAVIRPGAAAVIAAALTVESFYLNCILQGRLIIYSCLAEGNNLGGGDGGVRVLTIFEGSQILPDN